MTKKKSNWKHFEDKTHEIIERFNPNQEVLANIEIKGKLTKESRELDVAINSGNYDFIAFECKDHKRKIGSPVVEAFVTKLEDVRAAKGAIVSNSPYTSGAKNLAKAKDIDLLHIIDSGDSKIRTYLVADVLYKDISVKAFKISLGMQTKKKFSLSREPMELVITDERENKIKAVKVFKKLWNISKSPLSRNVGVYKYTIKDPQKHFVVSNEGELIQLSELSFIYKVIERYYLTKINIIETNGIYDVAKRSYKTRKLTTDYITPHKFQNKENEISKERFEKLKKQVAFGLTGISLYKC